MYRLQQQLSNRMDVIIFDVDNNDVTQTRYNFGMRSRSQYVLIDANQNVIKSWFGTLDEAAMMAELDQLLGSLGF